MTPPPAFETSTVATLKARAERAEQQLALETRAREDAERRATLAERAARDAWQFARVISPGGLTPRL